MKTGTDRSLPGYPGGTRHPCPFCDWYLDAEPLYDLEADAPVWSAMDRLSRRLDAINRQVLHHLGTEHPDEYRAADRLRVDITG